LAVAYEIDKAILAINIGASAPLILTSLSQGLQREGQAIQATTPTTESASPNTDEEKEVCLIAM
jgi:hypothetical protein